MRNMDSTGVNVHNEEAGVGNDEISLKDMVGFLKRNLRLIMLCGAVGLLLSTAYLLQMPTKYEAQWQVQMAQFANININTNINTNTNIEEPVALIQRLSVPIAYPIEIQQRCGIPEGAEFGGYLGAKLKVRIIKNVANAVEMKVDAASPDQAKTCAEGIAAMIVTQQRTLIEDRLAVRQEQLAQYQKQFLEEMAQLEKIKNSELANFGYLAKFDKLSWLRTRIYALQEEALLSRKQPAKLIAPINVPRKSVSHKVGLVLLLGMVVGLMLGALYAMGREGWRRAA